MTQVLVQQPVAESATRPRPPFPTSAPVSGGQLWITLQSGHVTKSRIIAGVYQVTGEADLTDLNDDLKMWQAASRESLANLEAGLEAE